MIDYDGRRFCNPADDDGVIAQYHQQGNLVWADFSGGNVRRGTVNGTCDSEGILGLAYTMVLVSGEVVVGYTLSTPESDASGRIRLREEWERYGASATTGISYLEEIR
ncbi:hypothetical protein P3H15_37370 [Rhodococcus sp. T2V]|uniref:hypothetical protein n=1 Tax=Rhodococcus sp. T2V TaxID=3034164 RepID=UPI0023E090B5|nr:hypothetical protein [Rhodococcus sp. T2V]MDF3310686.1 hypothetical protein [Rhodococcus sp. T2V]